jgi:hypothetical protein
LPGPSLLLHDPGGASLYRRIGKALGTGFVNITVNVGAAIRTGQRKRGGESCEDGPQTLSRCRVILAIRILFTQRWSGHPHT